MKLIRPHRNQPLWYAYLLHRVSGLVLALFLPVHFYVLSLALSNKKTLDNLLLWSEQPSVKVAEFALIFLLAVHLFGGLRLLALEFLPWQENQKTLVAVVLSLALFIGLTFLLSGY